MDYNYPLGFFAVTENPLAPSVRPKPELSNAVGSPPNTARLNLEDYSICADRRSPVVDDVQTFEEISSEEATETTGSSSNNGSSNQLSVASNQPPPPYYGQPVVPNQAPYHHQINALTDDYEEALKRHRRKEATKRSRDKRKLEEADKERKFSEHEKKIGDLESENGALRKKSKRDDSEKAILERNLAEVTRQRDDALRERDALARSNAKLTGDIQIRNEVNAAVIHGNNVLNAQCDALKNENTNLRIVLDVNDILIKKNVRLNKQLQEAQQDVDLLEVLLHENVG